MNHLSLFSGSGIGTLAAQEAGIVTVAHAENDSACCYCLERLWPDARLFRDVRDVTAESVADLGPIDIISGGFPCTDISTAGKGAGLGTEENPTRSGLWYEFARVIREVRPTWCLIENVPALRVRGGDRVTNDLEAMAYEWEAVVVGADDVGAPHRRKRVWIIGRRLEHTKHDGQSDAEVAGCFGSRGHDGTAGTRTAEQSAGSVDGGSRRTNVGNSGCERRQQDAGGSSCDEETHGRAGRKQRQQDGDNEPCRASEVAGLANPIGDLCGRGGDEPERGTEGRTAAGRAGEAVAYSERQRLEGTWCERWEQQRIRIGERTHLVCNRWPARPGEPQHPWEAPRLVEFGLGSPVNELARRIHERLDGSGNGISPDRAASRANKTLLRMCGNSWVFPLAKLLFELIVELDRGTMRTAQASLPPEPF